MIIQIEEQQGFFKITNDSEYDLMFSIKPVKPKRKFTDVFFIKNRTSQTFEKMHGDALDLTTLSLSFLKYSPTYDEESKDDEGVMYTDPGND